MKRTKKEDDGMTDAQFEMFLEALKIIVEGAESKEEILKKIEQIQNKGKKKTQ